VSELQHLVTREQIARREIGHTQISRAAAWTLALLFVATIAAVPAVQHAADVLAWRADRRDSLWPQAYDIFGSVAQAVDAAREADGSILDRVLEANSVLREAIPLYTDALEEESVVARALVPSAQEVLTGWLGRGIDRVYVGRGGALFYRPTVDCLTARGFLDPRQLARRAQGLGEGGEPLQPDPRAAILEFHRQLAARGIRLIVMPVPAKASVQPEMLAAGHEGCQAVIQNPSFAPFKQELEREGVLVFDVAQAFVQAKASGPQYLVADAHWRPEAMERAADLLAKFIEAQVLPEADYAVVYQREAEAVTNLGDTARMFRLPAGQRLFKPETVEIHPVVTPWGDLWRPTRSADILLLGDSFSNIYSLEAMGWGEAAGLAEQLSYYLHRPIDTRRRNGSGAYVTRARLDQELARGEDTLAGKRLVVWEFATYELGEGDWRPYDIRLGQPPPRRFFVPPSGHPVQVTGVVRSVSAVPRPRRLPYRNHIMAIHLVDLEGDAERISSDQAVVYLWSLRENRRQPAAGLRPDDTVTVRLRPWREVADEYDRLNRSELEDETLQLEEPCWGEMVTP
jgi:alginate O-acetyltransferase complex protein AlgJ